MRETFFVGSHCPRCPKALVSPSAAALYSAVIDLRPVSHETIRPCFRDPGSPPTGLEGVRSPKSGPKRCVDALSALRCHILRIEHPQLDADAARGEISRVTVHIRAI